MEAGALRLGIRQAIAAVRAPTAPRALVSYQSRRLLATPASDHYPSSSPSPADQPIRAAPPIVFDQNAKSQGPPADNDDSIGGPDYSSLLHRLRLLPRSSSYFTGKPEFTDDLLNLENLVRKYWTLPVLPPGEAPRIAWKTLSQYKVLNSEPVKAARYTKIVELLQRLNYIHPSLMPQEVKDALNRFMRDLQPFNNVPKPVYVDEYGRARGIGRRKSSHAVAYLVEGEGEVLINGKPLTDAFGTLHDRESAIWALKATDRVDKYNVWGIVKGGGTTGQAEALTLAVSKALMVHEPDLKPALRRGESVFHTPRSFFSFVVTIQKRMLTVPSSLSWLCHAGSSPGREEKAWQAQGSQDACLGQALKVSCTFICIILVTQQTCTNTLFHNLTISPSLNPDQHLPTCGER